MLKLKSENYNENLKFNVKHRAYLFSLNIIKFVATFPEKRVYWVIGDQLLRAGCSIGANLIEAQSFSSKKDFIRYYEIALKSDNETVYWLSLLKDTADVDPEKIEELASEAEEISRMTGASIITMKKTL